MLSIIFPKHFPNPSNFNPASTNLFPNSQRVIEPCVWLQFETSQAVWFLLIFFFIIRSFRAVIKGKKALIYYISDQKLPFMTINHKFFSTQIICQKILLFKNPFNRTKRPDNIRILTIWQCQIHTTIPVVFIFDYVEFWFSIEAFRCGFSRPPNPVLTVQIARWKIRHVTVFLRSCGSSNNFEKMFFYWWPKIMFSYLVLSKTIASAIFSKFLSFVYQQPPQFSVNCSMYGSTNDQ